MVITDPDFTLRNATSHDASAIANLLTELGHPANAADIPTRLAALLGAEWGRRS